VDTRKFRSGTKSNDNSRLPPEKLCRSCTNSGVLWELRPCPPEELSSSRSFVHSFEKSRVIPKRTAYFFRNAILQKVIRMILQEAASLENPFVSFSGKLNSSTGIQLSGKSRPSFYKKGLLLPIHDSLLPRMVLFSRSWSFFVKNTHSFFRNGPLLKISRISQQETGSPERYLVSFPEMVSPWKIQPVFLQELAIL